MVFIATLVIHGRQELAQVGGSWEKYVMLHLMPIIVLARLGVTAQQPNAMVVTSISAAKTKLIAVYLCIRVPTAHWVFGIVPPRILLFPLKFCFSTITLLLVLLLMIDPDNFACVVVQC
jgi:hypothetical protein